MTSTEINFCILALGILVSEVGNRAMKENRLWIAGSSLIFVFYGLLLVLYRFASN